MLHDTTHLPGSGFFVTGGTLRPDAQCYVARRADRELLDGLQGGEFCYVLTSRQMGKSSLMVRTADSLRRQGTHVVVLDLTAIGLNVTPEQWYDGVVARIGNALRLDEELESFWQANTGLGPFQRMMASLTQIILPGLRARAAARGGATGDEARLVIFVDEIDIVRSLPFSADEFFAGIRECYNRRVVEPDWNRLTFCLMGAATPADLIRDPRITPFNIGRCVELTDFADVEAVNFEHALNAVQPAGSTLDVRAALRRVYHWTEGHPYLTQRLCRALAETDASLHAGDTPETLVDRLADELFLGRAAQERDDNLLYVRERMLRTNKDLGGLLDLYSRIHQGEAVADVDGDPLIDELRLAGVVKVVNRHIVVRNRIYRTVFDTAWVRTHRPDALLIRATGEKIPVRGLCNIGRVAANDVVLPEEKVSRRHAQIQLHSENQFWLVDLGSSNGTYLNGRRISQPSRLYDQDCIEIGQVRFTFRQKDGARREPDRPLSDATVVESPTVTR